MQAARIVKPLNHGGTNLRWSIPHFLHLIFVFHELSIKFADFLLYRLSSTVNLEKIKLPNKNSNERTCIEAKIDRQAGKAGRHFEFDFELLTLEIASVRFGGGSFGFPRPNNLFILLQNTSFGFLLLLSRNLLRFLFSVFPS